MGSCHPVRFVQPFTVFRGSESMLTSIFHTIPVELEALPVHLTSVACFKQIYFFLKIILSILLKWSLLPTCGIPMVCVTLSVLTLC